MPTKRQPPKRKKESKPRARKQSAPAAAPLEGTEEMSTDLSQYVTTKKAAEMLGVVTEHVNHLLKKKKIKGVKLDGTRWLVYVPSIVNYAPAKSLGGRPRSVPHKPNSLAERARV